jgi:hypothetical protein
MAQSGYQKSKSEFETISNDQQSESSKQRVCGKRESGGPARLAATKTASLPSPQETQSSQSKISKIRISEFEFFKLGALRALRRAQGRLLSSGISECLLTAETHASEPQSKTEEKNFTITREEIEQKMDELALEYYENP